MGILSSIDVSNVQPQSEGGGNKLLTDGIKALFIKSVGTKITSGGAGKMLVIDFEVVGSKDRGEIGAQIRENYNFINSNQTTRTMAMEALVGIAAAAYGCPTGQSIDEDLFLQKVILIRNTQKMGKASESNGRKYEARMENSIRVMSSPQSIANGFAELGLPVPIQQFGGRVNIPQPEAGFAQPVQTQQQPLQQQPVQANGNGYSQQQPPRAVQQLQTNQVPQGQPQSGW